MALTQTQISMLYVSIFNRASEGEGNTYWQTTGLSLSETADKMLETQEAKDYFGTSLDTNQAFVEWIYQNTFNKTVAEDADGIKHWVDKLDAGETQGQVVEGIVNAVAAYKDATDATTKAAYDQFMNRVEVSDYTADNFEGANLATTMSDYKTKLGFNGDLTVTDDATTVTTAESIVDGLTTTASEVQKLTTSPDNFTGTNGDDTFDGSVVQNQINGWNVDTFSSSDRIDGGTGNDTLIIQQTGGSVSGAVSNVENIEFTAFGTTTYDMSNTTGVENFLNQNSVADVTVDGANAMNIGVKNINTKDTNITFASTVYTNTDDSTTLTLENVTGDANIQLTGADIETLNIESKTAGSKVDLGGTALDATTTLVITGDKDLSIDTAIDGTLDMVKLSTVDASAFTGDLDLDFNVLTNPAQADNKLNITGGTGDDRVTITNLNKDDVIDLGDGNDQLAVLVKTTDVTKASLKNIEEIAFATIGQGNTKINLEGATEVKEIVLRDGTDTVTLNKVASSLTDINFLNMTGTGSTTLNSVVLKLKDASGTDDSVGLNFASVDGKLQAVQMSDDNKLTVGTITANGIENITINTASLGKETKASDGIDGGLLINNFNADALKTLTITSDTYVDINSSTLEDTVKTVDSSGATAGVNLDLSAIADSSSDTSSTSVTTGTGADTLKVNAAVSSTIKTDAGNDSITLTGTTLGSKAKISIDAGEGNDTVDISTITALNSEIPTDTTKDGSIKVTLGDGLDTIKLNGAADYSITVTDFKAGAAGDKIDLKAGLLNTGKTFDSDHTNGMNGGLNLVNIDADSLSTTDVATALAAVVVTNNTYFVIDDGSDAGLYSYTGATGTAAAADLQLIVKLAGIDDVASLNSDNFADFL